MFLSWMHLSEPQGQKFEMSAKVFFVGNTKPSFHYFIVLALTSKCYCTKRGAWNSSNIHHPVCERQEMKLSNSHCVSWQYSSCLLEKDGGGI